MRLWCFLKSRRGFVAALLGSAVVLLTACTPYKTDYFGIWQALDDSGPDNVVYEYMITDGDTENGVTVRVIRKSYEFNRERTFLVWTESNPYYFSGSYDPDGGAVTVPFGVIIFEVTSGSLLYNNLRFAKRGRNTEAKLKFVARKNLKMAFPDVPVVD